MKPEAKLKVARTSSQVVVLPATTGIYANSKYLQMFMFMNFPTFRLIGGRWEAPLVELISFYRGMCSALELSEGAKEYIVRKGIECPDRY